MIKNFKWSEKSVARNKLTMQYEPIQVFLFISMSERISAKYIFDIGSNIGAYSLASSLVPSVAAVYSYEAEDVAYDNLIENVKLNNLETKVQAKNEAVSSSNGTVEFAVSTPMAGINAISSTSFHAAKHYTSTKLIKSVSLDGEYEFKGENISIKIDVEGHEKEVLLGAKGLLADNTCIVQVELYREADEIALFFAEIGYRKLFAISHDYYFTNSSEIWEDKEIVCVFEKSCSMMVRHNLQK